MDRVLETSAAAAFVATYEGRFGVSFIQRISELNKRHPGEQHSLTWEGGHIGTPRQIQQAVDYYRSRDARVTRV